MANEFETGGGLQELADFARNWFKENNVEVPSKAKDWQNCSVGLGEIPPGCTTGSLRRKGISALNFIKMIQGNPVSTKHTNDPINKSNCLGRTGLYWEASEMKDSGHRVVKTRCSECNTKEVLDYGTLQKMVVAKNRLCRLCRNCGGKRKPLNQYSSTDFKAVEFLEDSRIKLKCNKCASFIVRGLSHVKSSEYLVCEVCNPFRALGAKIESKHGAFDSVIEYKAYLKLLELIPAEDIHQQVSYNELFNTGTKHTADFYIPKLDLVLEVTTKGAHMKVGEIYRTTHDWKLGLSDRVKFAYSIKQVEDIVHLALLERVASNGGNVLCCCTFRRY